MTTSSQWQLARSAAERYQQILTPAILGPFATALVKRAALRPAERVADVGTGTGAAARAAATAVGVAGRVIAVDLNDGMLDVARSLPAAPGAAIQWRKATATALPLDDGSIDAVLCAQTLQFLPEKVASLREMARVLSSRGRLALSLWCDISDNPYFDALVAAVTRHIGPDVAVGLQAAFALTAPEEVLALLANAGLGQVDSYVIRLDLPFPNLAAFVPRHISATPMAPGFSMAEAEVQRGVVRQVVEEMRPYQRNGATVIPFRSHMFICRG